ncbi:MAG TPA: TIGR03435 family protein [Bryobacteraceae bacterium]|nr:TIGR03435 family protein [Bryobacteraceae bacterium]
MPNKLTAAIVLLGAFAVCAALGQTPAASAFEVASVKLAAPLNPADVAAGKLHVGLTIDGARVDIGFFSLADLIPVAFRVKRYQVSGPDWMAAQRFDIQAKIPDGASPGQVPEMLQALLAERFRLAMHRETKDHPVYALVVGKNGPKLKDAAPDTDAPAQDNAKSGVVIGSGDRQARVSTDGKGFVVTGGRLGGPTRMTMGPNGAMHLEASKMTLASFVDVLSPFLDRPVVDMTELKGNYQIALDLSMDDLRKVARTAGVALPGQAPGPESAGRPADAASDPSGGSIFNSVQQLGLKLEPRKAPLEMIVIDHLEKTPTDN